MGSEAFRVGIAGQIQPVSSPALSVMVGAQQALDHALVGIGPLILQVGVDFGGRGRHPHQVQVGPTQQLQRRGRRREAQSTGLQPGKQKGVHRRSHEPARPDSRHRGADRGLEGPEAAVPLGDGWASVGCISRGNRRVGRGAGGNPAAQQLQLGGGGRPYRIGQLQLHRGHLPGLDLLDDRAPVGIPRNNGRTGTAPSQPGDPRAQVQSGLLAPLAVTGHAAHLEDGQHVLLADSGKA